MASAPNLCAGAGDLEVMGTRGAGILAGGAISLTIAMTVYPQSATQARCSTWNFGGVSRRCKFPSDTLQCGVDRCPAMHGLHGSHRGWLTLLEACQTLTTRAGLRCADPTWVCSGAGAVVACA